MALWDKLSLSTYVFHGIRKGLLVLCSDGLKGEKISSEELAGQGKRTLFKRIARHFHK